ncbi:MAG: hypothetical protein ABL931_02135, partial [Usitatibacteraceae bacterium]
GGAIVKKREPQYPRAFWRIFGLKGAPMLEVDEPNWMNETCDSPCFAARHHTYLRATVAECEL